MGHQHHILRAMGLEPFNPRPDLPNGIFMSVAAGDGAVPQPTPVIDAKTKVDGQRIEPMLKQAFLQALDQFQMGVRLGAMGDQNHAIAR